MLSSEAEIRSFIDKDDVADVRVLGLFGDKHSIGRWCLLLNIYNGIIFPSLNHVKSNFSMNSCKQVVRQWANHMCSDVQRGRAEPIQRGPCHLSCAKSFFEVI